LFKLNGVLHFRKGVKALKIFLIVLLVLFIFAIVLVLALVAFFRLFVTSTDNSATELEYMTKDGRFREEVFPIYPARSTESES